MTAERQRRNQAKRQAERIVLDAASAQHHLTYGDLVDRIEAITYAPNAPEVTDILTWISRKSFKERGCLVSAVVVRADNGRPGTGFFELLRKLRPSAVGKDDACWRSEVDLVYRTFGDDQQPGLGR